jgi:hypothetical protein
MSMLVNFLKLHISQLILLHWSLDILQLGHSCSLFHIPSSYCPYNHVFACRYFRNCAHYSVLLPKGRDMVCWYQWYTPIPTIPNPNHPPSNPFLSLAQSTTYPALLLSILTTDSKSALRTVKFAGIDNETYTLSNPLTQPLLLSTPTTSKAPSQC